MADMRATRTTPRIIFWDLMDTLVRDPFFTHMAGFFGDTFEGLVARLAPKVWVEFELGRMEEAELFRRFFRDGTQFDGPGLKRHVIEAYAWIEGMEPLLHELRAREVPMHALSNYPLWYQSIEERLGLSRYVTLSFISCLTGVRKPEPAAFLDACAQLQCLPTECLLVDDRAQNCEAARALGLSAVHFTGDAASVRAALVEHGLL